MFQYKEKFKKKFETLKNVSFRKLKIIKKWNVKKYFDKKLK
jgi:hypothetical protein